MTWKVEEDKVYLVAWLDGLVAPGTLEEGEGIEISCGRQAFMGLWRDMRSCGVVHRAVVGRELLQPELEGVVLPPIYLDERLPEEVMMHRKVRRG